MTHPDSMESRVAALEERLRESEDRLRLLEDEREIRELLAAYGFTVDSCLDDAYVDLFTSDGVMDLSIGGTGAYASAVRWEGTEGIRGFISDPAGNHDPRYYGKVLHLQGNNLVIRVTGDEAVANSYSVVLFVTDAETVIRTAGANEWAFRREHGRWRYLRRTRREVGSSEFEKILRTTLGSRPFAAPMTE